MNDKKNALILIARFFLASVAVTALVMILRILTVDDASLQQDWPKYMSIFGILFFGTLLAVVTTAWIEQKFKKK